MQQSGNSSILFLLLMPVSLALLALASATGSLLESRSDLRREFGLAVRDAARNLPEVPLAAETILRSIRSLDTESLYNTSFTATVTGSDIEFQLSSDLKSVAAKSLGAESVRPAFVMRERLAPLETVVLLPGQLNRAVLQSWNTGREIGIADDASLCSNPLSEIIRSFLAEFALLRSFSSQDQLRILSLGSGASNQIRPPILEVAGGAAFSSPPGAACPISEFSSSFARAYFAEDDYPCEMRLVKDRASLELTAEVSARCEKNHPYAVALASATKGLGFAPALAEPRPAEREEVILNQVQASTALTAGSGARTIRRMQLILFVDWALSRSTVASLQRWLSDSAGEGRSASVVVAELGHRRNYSLGDETREEIFSRIGDGNIARAELKSAADFELLLGQLTLARKTERLS